MCSIEPELLPPVKNGRSNHKELMPTKPQNSYPPWAPRFWNGMRLQSYYRLLAENQFQIHPLRIPMAVLGTGVCIINSFFGCLQDVLYGRKIKKTKLIAPPIFIIGHWRSGTTLMHELLTLDDQFSCPSTFDAFTPTHSAVTKWFLKPVLNALLPGKRPMDGMSLDAHSPQEDDFALISLDAPTMYRKVAFPNRRFELPAGDMQDNVRRYSRSIDRAMLYFLQVLTANYRKRLILKSPPHTARIEQLARQFPGARFVHISRHPFQIVPSTMKLWRALDWTQGFQIPKYSDQQLMEYIFAEQTWLYQHYDEQVTGLEPNQLVEIRFEDLIADPQAVTERVYSELDLKGCETLLPKIADYFESTRSVKPSGNTKDASFQQEISTHWHGYMKRFGYEH